MATFHLRLQFVDEQKAYEMFHVFPPSDLHYIDGWSRKRDGASQVVALQLTSEARLRDFVTFCMNEKNVIGVISITKEEFEKAPSNAI
jgi:hypothetical protein